MAARHITPLRTFALTGSSQLWEPHVSPQRPGRQAQLAPAYALAEWLVGVYSWLWIYKGVLECGIWFVAIASVVLRVLPLLVSLFCLLDLGKELLLLESVLPTLL